jgi:hypothetical protein
MKQCEYYVLITLKISSLLFVQGVTNSLQGIHQINTPVTDWFPQLLKPNVVDPRMHMPYGKSIVKFRCGTRCLHQSGCQATARRIYFSICMQCSCSPDAVNHIYGIIFQNLLVACRKFKNLPRHHP